MAIKGHLLAAEISQYLARAVELALKIQYLMVTGFHS